MYKFIINYTFHNSWSYKHISFLYGIIEKARAQVSSCVCPDRKKHQKNIVRADWFICKKVICVKQDIYIGKDLELG